MTVSLCTLPLATEAADRLKVSLTVSAKADIKNQAEIYLRRELGGLNDVDIVDRDPDLAVRIIVLEQTPQAGRKTGVALATLVVMPFENAFVKNAAQEKYKETVGKVTDALFYSPDMFLRVGEELQKVCKDAIAGLDGDQFEDIRKTRRDIENALRPYRPREKK